MIPLQTLNSYLQLTVRKLDQVVERTAKTQQQQMNQLTDMNLTLTSLISFHSQ